MRDTSPSGTASDGEAGTASLEASFVAVAELSRIPQGNGALRIEVDGHSLLLFRDGDQVHACQGTCPHEKADLSQGRVENGRLLCPRHLASFDLTDGSVSAGWRTDPLRLYPLRIEDGRVLLDRAAVQRNPPAGPRQRWDFTGR